MRRGLGNKGIRERINKLKEEIPNIALRTTLIVGHPGETEEDYDILSNFVEEVRFDRLGIFTYSEEEGTLAANLKDEIPRKLKDDRKNRLLDIQHEISLEKNESYIGKKIRVLVDKTGSSLSIGRTEFDSPEIDNIVHIENKVDAGKFVNVKIEKVNEYELIGKII